MSCPPLSRGRQRASHMVRALPLLPPAQPCSAPSLPAPPLPSGRHPEPRRAHPPGSLAAQTLLRRERLLDLQRRRVPALTLVPAQLVLATLSRPRRPCSGRFRRRRRTPDTPLAARCVWLWSARVGVVVSRVGAQRVLWCVPVASYDTPTTSTPRGSRERVARAVPGRAKS